MRALIGQMLSPTPKRRLLGRRGGSGWPPPSLGLFPAAVLEANQEQNQEQAEWIPCSCSGAGRWSGQVNQTRPAMKMKNEDEDEDERLKEFVSQGARQTRHPPPPINYTGQ